MWAVKVHTKYRKTTTNRQPRQQRWHQALMMCSFAANCTVLGSASPSLAQQMSTGRELKTAIRGITVGPIESSLQPKRGYGSPQSEQLLVFLSEMGVNWVSVTPFGRIWSTRSTQIQMDFEAPWEQTRNDVLRFAKQAHRYGIKVLLVPHLWVEAAGLRGDSLGNWRGQIDPPTTEGWRQYLQAYKTFIMRWAEVAEQGHLDALAIGVECVSWSSRYPQVWNQLIAESRARFSGLLTYSANWDEVDNVIFWDRLDFIGINAFFPLAQEGSARPDYVDGAKRAADLVETWASLHHKPIVFAELGYTTRRHTGIQPWLWPDSMQSVAYDEADPSRAFAAMFAAFLPKPWFKGFFVWRYYANLDDVSQEQRWGFSPHAKQAEQLLRVVFQQRWASDQTTWPWQQPSPCSARWLLGCPHP